MKTHRDHRQEECISATAAAPASPPVVIVGTGPVGVHCANVFDAGTLTAPATVALRIVYP